MRWMGKPGAREIGTRVSELERQGVVKVVGKMVDPVTGYKVLAYRLTGEPAQPLARGPRNAGDVTREAVVEYLAAISEEEWDSVLTEAAARAFD
jgi:hypothetical protein